MNASGRSAVARWMRPYRSRAYQSLSICGSRVASEAFIGKSVCGRLIVSL